MSVRRMPRVPSSPGCEETENQQQRLPELQSLAAATPPPRLHRAPCLTRSGRLPPLASASPLGCLPPLKPQKENKEESIAPKLNRQIPLESLPPLLTVPADLYLVPALTRRPTPAAATIIPPKPRQKPTPKTPPSSPVDLQETKKAIQPPFMSLICDYVSAIRKEEQQTQPEYRAQLIENAAYYLQDADKSRAWLAELSEIAINYEIRPEERIAIIQALRRNKGRSAILCRPEFSTAWLRLLGNVIQDLDPRIRAIGKDWLMTDWPALVRLDLPKTLTTIVFIVGAAASNSRLPLPERAFWQGQLTVLWSQFIRDTNVDIKTALVRQLGNLASNFDYGCYDPGLTPAEKQIAINLFFAEQTRLIKAALTSPELHQELTRQMEILKTAAGSTEQAHRLGRLFLLDLNPPNYSLPPIQ